jgi:hypothetical protein
MKLCESASPDRSIGERKARARLTTDLAGETADNPTPWDVSAGSHAAGACNSESTETVARSATGGNDSFVAGPASSQCGLTSTGNHIAGCAGTAPGRTTVRKALIQCHTPNCGAHYVALLQNEAPPTAPLCIECGTPLPPTVDGEFVYFAVSPSTSASRMGQAAPDRTAAEPRSNTPPTSAQTAKTAPFLIVKSLEPSFKSRWQTLSSRVMAYPAACYRFLI